MPPRKKITLPEDVRRAFEERLKHSQQVADRAEEDFYIEIALMNAAGMTIEEIAATLEARTSTVGDWKRKGDQARERRRREDPDRSGELVQNGS
ncbi:hypothetical protein ACFRMN_19330 [Streptomyces sp. NPDC056835]|uniref:hypothetical protein n=1 Tax=Streptomyces sp. NPDC056835 TaxID=3345956 RepID=UPI00367971AA